MWSSSSIDREILSKLPTVLRHNKLQSKTAHFAALDSAYVYKTIQNQYRTSFYAFEYLLWKFLVLFKKAAIDALLITCSTVAR